MPNYTPNLNLVKPLVTEQYDIAKVTNENADILDLEIKAVKDDVLDKQDALVSGTNIKSVNGSSILSSGDLELLPKNNPTAIGTQTLPNIVTNGIKFPATQVPSADPNTLDDYEEGTWTPVVSSQDSGAITAYTINTATYIKIGKSISISVRLTITNKGTGSGNLYITLPFSSTGGGSGCGRITNTGVALSVGVGPSLLYALKYDGTNPIDNYEYNLSATYTQA